MRPLGLLKPEALLCVYVFSADVPGLAWTFDMRRMCVLVGQAWKFQEPVLLVGETGCGKTTAVQVVKHKWAKEEAFITYRKF